MTGSAARPADWDTHRGRRGLPPAPPPDLLRRTVADQTARLNRLETELADVRRDLADERRNRSVILPNGWEWTPASRVGAAVVSELTHADLPTVQVTSARGADGRTAVCLTVEVDSTDQLANLLVAITNWQPTP